MLFPIRCLLLTVVPVALLSAGCATHAERVHLVRQHYTKGNLPAADAALNKLQRKPKRDADVLKLDQAIVELVSGKPGQAEQLLRNVRDRFDELDKPTAGENALALASDDRRRPYAGEDYERLLIRVFLAIASLMSDGGDANAYALQIQDHQDLILRRYAEKSESKSPPPFKRVGIAPYLRAALLEESYSDFDDLTRSRVRVVAWEEQFRDGRADLERARTGRHSEPGNGVVYIIALVGRGPYKVETDEQPTSAALLIADRILSATLDQSLPPTIASVKVADVVTSNIGPSEISVRVDGVDSGTTATITDVGQLATEQYRAVYPEVIARAVVRRVAKKSAVYAAKDRADANRDPVVDLLFSAAGVAWEAAEHADTRCWGLLPDRIQVLRLEVPAGSHELSLNAILPGRRTGPPANASIDVADGRNTYVLASFPDDRLVGTIQTSGD